MIKLPKDICRFILYPDFRIRYTVNLLLRHKDKHNLLYHITNNSLRNKHHIIIARNCSVGNQLNLPHPQNIVIGSDVIIGDNCIIYHDVTVGQNLGRYPRIGDNVIIYAGAKIIGGITVGDNAIVGANAVVTSDVPDNAIVAGIPARVLRFRGETDEFY